MDRSAPDPGIDATLPADAGSSTATLGSLGRDDRYLRGGVFASGGMGQDGSARIWRLNPTPLFAFELRRLLDERTGSVPTD